MEEETIRIEDLEEAQQKLEKILDGELMKREVSELKLKERITSVAARVNEQLDHFADVLASIQLQLHHLQKGKSSVVVDSTLGDDESNQLAADKNSDAPERNDGIGVLPTWKDAKDEKCEFSHNPLNSLVSDVINGFGKRGLSVKSGSEVDLGKIVGSNCNYYSKSFLNSVAIYGDFKENLSKPEVKEVLESAVEQRETNLGDGESMLKDDFLVEYIQTDVACLGVIVAEGTKENRGGKFVEEEVPLESIEIVQTNENNAAMMNALDDGIPEESSKDEFDEPKTVTDLQGIKEAGDEINEAHLKDYVLDGNTCGMILGNAEVVEKFVKKFEEESRGNSHAGLDSSLEQSYRIYMLMMREWLDDAHQWEIKKQIYCQQSTVLIVETVSGNSVVFVLPMLTYITMLPPLSKDNEVGPYVVEMAHTRELIQQIEDETAKLVRYSRIKLVSIVGQFKKEQDLKIRQSWEVVIDTLGCIIDCFERRYAVPYRFNFVILDEVDHNTDVGFETQVVGELYPMPSSNMKPEKENYKMDRVRRLLDELGNRKIVILVNTKKVVDKVTRILDKNGQKVTIGHGGKAQGHDMILLTNLDQVVALALGHTEELTYQICHEFEQVGTDLLVIRVVIYDGVNVKAAKDRLKNECLQMVVGVLGLAKDKDISLRNVRQFIFDECDKMLEFLDTRVDVHEIFKKTSHDKQVVMISATPNKEVYVDDDAKLALYCLVQLCIKLSELENNWEFNYLLDALDFNQAVNLIPCVTRAHDPSICTHSGIFQEEELTLYMGLKEQCTWILATTDLCLLQMPTEFAREKDDVGCLYNTVSVLFYFQSLLSDGFSIWEPPIQQPCLEALSNRVSVKCMHLGHHTKGTKVSVVAARKINENREAFCHSKIDPWGQGSQMGAVLS